MKQRLVMLALAAGCIVLAVAGALVYLGQDRKRRRLQWKIRKSVIQKAETMRNCWKV